MNRRTGWVIFALAVLAGLRVLLLSLAFPFFTNVDEHRHLDVVLKYARGYWPVPGPDRYEPDTARWVARLGSPEYHRDPDAPERAEVPAPPWRSSPEAGARRLAEIRRYLEAGYSLEADQPPLYYATAGAWLALGRDLGLRGGPLLYWVRGLGALAACALVWACGWLLRDLYPERALVWLGVPLLIAVFPQDALYYVTGDAFSPLLGGLAFLLLVRLVARPRASAGAHAAAGLLLAAAFLNKYPNVALLAAAGVCTLAARRAPTPAPLGRWLLLWGLALLPPLAWLVRNQLLGGDLTGTAFKVEQLGWGRKSFAEWWDHPILTPAGAWVFLRDLIPTFWRGEVVWYRNELAWSGADAVYRASSLVFVGLAALGLRRSGRRREVRVAEGAALAATCAAVGTLAGLSLLFEFHAASSPSIDYPYFVQGRLISGVLVPFALLFVRGIDEATGWLPERLRDRAAWGLLAAVVTLASVSETALSWPVFHSAYNFYHLP